MADDRTPEQIQRDIEQARVTLADSLDQLAERTSPKRLAAHTKDSLLDRARSPQGMAVVGGSIAAVVGLIVLARVRASRA